jgi:catechol 2,3-dioxygenase
VRLQVADLTRAMAFYERVLGLQLIGRPEGRALLGAMGGGRPLVELHERPGATPMPREGRLGLYHFALLLPDRAALGRFVAHLSGLGLPAGSANHLVSEALYLHDPDGLGIEVYADRPRDTWQTRGGELAMASDWLDLRDLVAAGGGERWTGAPSGTTVGHLHLHVADLAAAAAFYRDALGFAVTVSSYPGALFLSAGGYHHHLGVNVWAGADATPPGPNDAQLLEWELVLPSAEASGVAERLAAAGHAVERAKEGWVVADPWRTKLRLVSEKPQSPAKR